MLHPQVEQWSPGIAEPTLPGANGAACLEQDRDWKCRTGWGITPGRVQLESLLLHGVQVAGACVPCQGFIPCLGSFSQLFDLLEAHIVFRAFCLRVCGPEVGHQHRFSQPQSLSKSSRPQDNLSLCLESSDTW